MPANQRILIIEDEKNLSRFVELELKHEGYETKVCEDGSSGLQLSLIHIFQIKSLLFLNSFQLGFTGCVVLTKWLIAVVIVSSYGAQEV